jgi:nucleoside 2-deoxyribosyltransferase
MSAPPRIYLAGPDVFLPDPLARAARLKAVCAAHGLCGVFPLDPAGPAVPEAETEWERIALANEAHIRDADALIANLTPFRGPSADPGTVYELGFAAALGRPVFGWSGVGGTLRERMGAAVDAEGMAVEDFGLAENLMLVAAIARGGGRMVAETLAAPWDDLRLFETCVAAAAAVLLSR